MFSARFLGFVVLGLTMPLWSNDEAQPRKAKEALQGLGDLIGTWRGTGTPSGSCADQQKGFWVETLTWQWQFKGTDTWFKVSFDKSKNFSSGELRYLPDQNAFALTLTTPAKDQLTFTGNLVNKVLTLERPAKNETQRLVFTLLHDNRFLYRYEIQPAGKTLFNKIYSVGATKEGVAFAAGDGRPECVVSGGLGTLTVSYMNKTLLRLLQRLPRRVSGKSGKVRPGL